MSEVKKKVRPNRLGMYSDVKVILDEALKYGGGTYELASHGQAVWWRQRAYTFRKLYATTIHPQPSPYDTLTFKKIPDDSATVVIGIGQQRGIFRPPTSVVPLPVREDQGEDELMKEAADTARRLGLDGDAL